MNAVRAKAARPLLLLASVVAAAAVAAGCGGGGGSSGPSPTPPPAPVAQFTADVTGGTVPLTVQFTDQSLGTPSSWSWDFGDTGTSTVQNPSHTYTSPGTYTVVLAVTGTAGADSLTQIDYVTVADTVPVAAFTSDVVSGTAPLDVQFTDQSTGSLTGWSWDFGDTESSTEPSPAHTYATPGTYTVALTVTGPGGADTATLTDLITVLHPALTASFAADVTGGDAPLAVQFSDQSTGTVSSWSWDFGDTQTSTAQDPGHTYAAPGTYTVVLVVTGPGGSDSMTRTDYITAVRAPRLVGSSTSRPSTIYDLNRFLGGATTISGSAMDGTIVGLAHDGAGNVLYGLEASSPATLVTIDPVTAVATPVGSTTVDDMAGLAWDPDSSTLYAVSTNPGTLHTLDVTTGAATAVGPLGGTFDAVASLAYDPGADVLYGLDAGTRELLTISTVDGTSAAVGVLSGGVSITSLGFDAASSSLLGYGDTGKLYSIDTTDASLTPIGFAGFPSVHGLAVDTGTGRVWGIEAIGGAARSALIEIDGLDGSASSVVSAGLGNLQGLTRIPSTGRIYAVQNNSGLLSEVDPCTGELSPIGYTGFSEVRSLAYDPTGPGTMYGVHVVDGGADLLITINPATGLGTPAATISVPNVNIEGLAWDGSTSTLFASMAGGGSVFLGSINPVSGQLTVIGNTGFRVGGLAVDSETNLLYGTSLGAQLILLNKTSGVGAVVGSSVAPIAGLTFED